MATLRDVAESASVSIATASRVLNGSSTGHPVSTEVRQAVLAAAEALDYTPSAPARALKQQRSRVIGVVVSDILDPYFAEVARAIEIEASRHGYVTILANANRDPGQELARFRVLREHQASGIVFCGSDIAGAPGTEELAHEVDRAVLDGARIVSLAPRAFAAEEIVVDNAGAAVELTGHLLGLGHRDIVFAGGLPGLAASEQRIAGYRAAMRDAGATPRVIGQTGMSPAAGRAAAAELLAGGLPDAILCTNDEVATGVLAELWAAGREVPADVSVAGFGGTRTGEALGLTTMVLPLDELGTLAARLIATEPGAAPAPTAPPAVLRIGRTTRGGSGGAT